MAGLTVTALLFAGMRGLEQDRSRSEFDQVAETRFAAVSRSLGEVTHALRAINLLFVVNDEVSREQFSTYARSVISLSPYLQALVFQRFVSADERAAFEAERRRTRPGFQITERTNSHLVRAPPRERYLVNDFISPFAGNEVTQGFNAWAHAPQRQATQRAIDTGQPVASGIVQLLQQGGAQRGILVVMPVYSKGAALPDAAARRAAAIGDTEVVISVTELIRENLDDARLLERPGVALAVFGPADGGGAERAFQHSTILPEVEDSPGWLSWLAFPAFTQTRWFDLAGGRWQAMVKVQDGTVSKNLASLLTLLLGVALSVLAAAYTQSRVRRTRCIERLVEERTAALKRTTDLLRLHQRAIESSANAIIIVSATHAGYPIEYVNPSYQRMMGYTAEEIVGRTLTALAEAEPDQAAIEELRCAIRMQREGQTLLRHRRKDGSLIYSEIYIAPVKDAAGRTEHFVLTQYDVTIAKRYEQELEHRSRYDTLTGLANRALLVDRMEQALAFAATRNEPVWLAVIDLDHFKMVNDTLGHYAGDKLLQVVAPRITAALPRTDTVARTGGDEFVLVLTGCTDEGQVAETVKAVMDAIAEPILIEGHEFVVSSSAGVSAYPADGADHETLLKHAEIAMYRAKEIGGNAIRFFTPKMNARALERLALETALRNALAHDEFELYYQPQVDLATGWVVGTEALIRWRHPQLGMVGPQRFIALAEETGLIVPIGAWVLRTACLQNRAWQDAGYGPLRVAVNLSARQFAQPDLLREVAGVLDEARLSAPCLEIELTESLVMDNVELGIRTMHELKALGVQLSIDDFGTGYSSLSYLKRFPFDVLKIDQSFVRDISVHPDDASLVGAIISLAHGLRKHVIAEGVETLEQLDYLRGKGCDEVQGDLFSSAVPRAEFERILREGRSVQPNPGLGRRQAHA